MHDGLKLAAAFHRIAFLQCPGGRTAWPGSNLLAVLAASAVLFCGTSLCQATTSVLGNSFDGPDTSWQLLDTGVKAQLRSQECTSRGVRETSGAEQLVVAAGGGQSVLFTCSIAQVSVIDELSARMWVSANRPSVQLAARITLPRSINSKDKKPATVIVRGTSYDRPGQWQQLTLSDVPKLLADEVRVLRAMAGFAIDPREAFIDTIVLVVPGDPEGVDVLTDELVVDGVLRTAPNEVELAVYPGPATSGNAVGTALPDAATAMRRGPAIRDPAAPTANSPVVRLHGGLLLVNGSPFLPRIIQGQGEPLQFLAERGFNVVQIDSPPTPEQTDEARRHSLWFLSTPPHPDKLASEGIGNTHERVLAWWLNDAAIDANPNYGRSWAELVRDRDPMAGRPVIVAPELDRAAAIQATEVVIAHPARIDQLTGPAFEQWLLSRAQAARPGTPLWAGFSTQFGDLVGQQCSSLAGAKLPPPGVDATQLETLVLTACTRGIPGYWFFSNSSLSEIDVATRQRIATLEIINRRLQLIEPWLASGEVTSRLTSSVPAWSGIVLHVDRARLMIPTRDPNVSLSTPSSSAAQPPVGAEAVFIVPGVPESSQVFAISPTAMRTLPVQRVAGGVRMTLHPDDGSFVLITEDPQIIQSMRQRVFHYGARVVRLERDRAAQRAMSITATSTRLAQLGYRNDAAAKAAAANALLPQIEPLITGGRAEQAAQVIASAKSLLEQAAADLRRAAPASPALGSDPLKLSDDLLSEYASTQKALGTLRSGENLLYGGDFEDLGQMKHFGWQHFSDKVSGINAQAELSTNSPNHGTYCLEMRATAAAPGQSPNEMQGAPVWIQSPPIPVTSGQVIEITGWVRIDHPTTGGDGGLQIVDSLGGPELALAIRQTTGWQAFRMIRAVPETTELRLTFAMTGLGLARLDAVMVRALQQPAARRLPETAPPTQSPKTAASQPSGSLFAVPQAQ